MSWGNALDGLAGDLACLFPNFRHFAGREVFDAAFGINASAPENFVRHPIANSSKRFLHEQRSFDGNFFATGEEFFDEGVIEGGFLRLWREIAPPGWSVFALVKLDAAKLPGIVKDERALLLKEDEMIVFAWREIGGFG